MSWALITGGARNIGAGISLALAREGYHVIVHYKNSQKEAEAVVEACRNQGVLAESLYGDFSTREGLALFTQKLLERFPSIKVLINNVGNFVVKSALDTTPEEWRDLYQTNFQTPLTLIHVLIPSIRRQQGCIINIGAAGLSLKAETFSTAYTATKMSLLILTKALAKELASAHVRVNMVSPGQLVESMVKSKIPMGRYGEVDDVVRVVLFLLNEANSYITGQNIEVAGGFGL